ncbi:MAG: hypothetical protein Q4E91_05875 [Lachnospiraceae bacterium]|nr:hypothetical protein [Lachnospiraceae bacterium]
MNYKKWNLAFLCLVLAVFAVLASVNYFVDPFGYFSFQAGDYEAVDFPVDTTYYQRELKAQHVLHYSDNYDAYLIGGSKSGSYRVEKLQELDGYRYYSLYEAGGSFYEYELETEFLLKYADPKKIVLSISGGEVNYLKRNQEDITVKVPAILTGESRFLEMTDFLFMDITRSIDRLKERLNGKTYAELTPTGERNLSKYYQKIENGTDMEQYTREAVLDTFAARMKTLFTKDKEASYIEESLASLKRIKKMCDSSGVELMVIVAPSFISEMGKFESSYFRNYLNEIALVTDYWDFSGFHDIDLNPYNFYNDGHFYYEVADLVIDTITGKDSYPGFGCYVTKENAAQHLAEREADYERLQQEYLETGTIRLLGQEDESCLVKNETEK